MRTRPNFGIIGQAAPTLNTTGIVKTLADYTATAIISTAQTNTLASGNTATGGSSITYYGDYRIHTFTGSGSFTAQHTGYIQYLVIAGGGGGADGGSTPDYGGAGGAGGFLEYYQSDDEYGDFKGPRMTVTTGDIISVVVGGGGARGVGVGTLSGWSGSRATSGSPSYLYNNTTKQYVYSFGGGAGGSAMDYTALRDPPGGQGAILEGLAGGSGGGGGAHGWGTYGQGAAGPGGRALGYPAIQGYDGGSGSFTTTAQGGGLGGGAGGAGTSIVAVGTPPSIPTNSRSATITGSSQSFSNGGGQGRLSAQLTAPTANTGNGGHAGAFSGYSQAAGQGTDGASGIVIIRYKFR